MQLRQASFLNSTGEKVYLAVGSYSIDPSLAGLCFRVTTDTIDRDIIMQVIDQEDVSHLGLPAGSLKGSGNVQILVADGGLGSADSCSIESSPLPQFLSSLSDWGDIYGGWATADQCDRLPEFPVCGQHPQDSLRDLCRWSFSAGFRTFPGSAYPSIQKMCKVACPSELYLATGLHRSDETATGYTCSAETNSAPLKLQKGASLTRSMNCAKPFYGFAGTVNGETYQGASVVVPCRRDGYARINSVPTQPPTAAPTFTNTHRPTRKPSARPTFAPSARPSIEPTLVPSGLPTLAPTNSSQLVRPEVLAAAGLSEKVLEVVLSPGGEAAMGVFVLLLCVVAVICVCERSLAQKQLAAKIANTEKVKAEKRKTMGIAGMAPLPTGRRQSTSPFKKITNFFAPRRANLEELEVIL